MGLWVQVKAKPYVAFVLLSTKTHDHRKNITHFIIDVSIAFWVDLKWWRCEILGLMKESLSCIPTPAKFKSFLVVNLLITGFSKISISPVWLFLAAIVSVSMINPCISVTQLRSLGVTGHLYIIFWMLVKEKKSKLSFYLSSSPRLT